MTEVHNSLLQYAMLDVLGAIPQHFVKSLNQEHGGIIADNAKVTGVTNYIVGNLVFVGESVGNNCYYPLNQVKFVSQIPLAPALLDRHIAWWKKYQDYEREWKAACQAVSSVVMRQKTWQDLRDVFPDHVIRRLISGDAANENMADLVRTRSDVYPGARPDGEDSQAMMAWQQEFDTRAKLWGDIPVNLYSRVAPVIDTYIGFSLI